jgi:hypothetical protein
MADENEIMEAAKAKRPASNYQTEENAYKIWCPLVRVVNGEMFPDGRSNHTALQAPYNRVVDGTSWGFPQGGACVASRCMAWRWAQGSNEVGGIKRVDPEDSRPVGYCGAFGRPEV